MNDQGLELAVPMGVSGAYLLDKNRFGQIRETWVTFLAYAPLFWKWIRNSNGVMTQNG